MRAFSIELANAAEDHLPHMSRTDTFPLPHENHVRFFLVTDRGVFSGEAQQDDLAYERHPLAPLFYIGHDLLTAIREWDPIHAQ